MLLQTLATLGRLHGYSIAARLEQVSAGALQVNMETLYPGLMRLEQRGYVRSEWNVTDTNRKARFYSITAAGRRQLATQKAEWDRMTTIMHTRLHDLARDIRYGLRTLRSSPVFTAVALLTVALGIGANTAIFTIVNGVILRPLGYPKPEQVMYLSTYNSFFSSEFPVAPAEYFEFRDINRSFADVGAFTLGKVNLTAGDRPLRVRAALVDEHLLNTLGLQAAQGRLFARGETDVNGQWAPGNEPPPAPVAILSHELWQTAFGGGSIVGQTIDVDGRRREVIGIMPPAADVM